MILKGIKNSTVPNSSGYTLDIKTKSDAGIILETLTSGFFLASWHKNCYSNCLNDNGAGGGTANNNTKDEIEADVDNVTVFFSPASGGQMEQLLVDQFNLLMLPMVIICLVSIQGVLRLQVTSF